MTSQIPETRFLIIPMEYPVLRMPDRLTVLEAVQFKDLFHHLIAQTPTPEKVILDLNATQFMDSSGLFNTTDAADDLTSSVPLCGAYIGTI